MMYVVRRLPESWSRISVFLFLKSKQNLKKSQNLMSVKAYNHFSKKQNKKKEKVGVATHPKSSNKELCRRHFEKFAFCLNEVIEVAGLE